MILKINRKSKGKRGVVEYLLNAREQEGTAITLRGNPHVSQALIQNIERKHKYLSGGLMFTKEEQINESQKNEIMDAFEQILFIGLHSKQFNILWIEHNDKGRLELNFVVPRIELNTGNDLDLYSHRRDLPIFDMWKNGINTKYKLVDPNDPRRARTMSERTKVARGSGYIVANRKNLDETLHKLVQDGHIMNREQMIELLKKSGYEITRKNSENISVKHMDIGKKALRLRGGIYSEKFSGTKGIESLSKERKQRIAEYDNKVARGENGTDRTTYQKYLQTRTERHQKRYQRPRRTYKKESQIIEKGDRNDLDTTTTKQNQRIKVDDRIRKLIETSSAKRKERINRVRDRENKLFEQITDSNIQLSSSFKRTAEELFRELTDTRSNVGNNIAKSRSKFNEEINRENFRNRTNANRLHGLLTEVNQQFSSLKKSNEGVVNALKKLKLFNLAKREIMSKRRPTINLSPRR